MRFEVRYVILDGHVTIGFRSFGRAWEYAQLFVNGWRRENLGTARPLRREERLPGYVLAWELRDREGVFVGAVNVVDTGREDPP